MIESNRRKQSMFILHVMRNRWLGIQDTIWKKRYKEKLLVDLTREYNKYAPRWTNGIQQNFFFFFVRNNKIWYLCKFLIGRCYQDEIFMASFPPFWRKIGSFCSFVSEIAWMITGIGIETQDPCNEAVRTDRSISIWSQHTQMFKYYSYFLE